MSGVVDTLFGGVDDSGQRANLRQNEQSRQYIQQQHGLARNDISAAYNPMAQALTGGYQGALDVYGQFAPQQLNALGQGNYNAQQQIMAGLPAFQQALMGTPINMSRVFQPQQITYDPSMFQRQLPQTVASPQYNPLGGVR